MGFEDAAEEIYDQCIARRLISNSVAMVNTHLSFDLSERSGGGRCTGRIDGSLLQGKVKADAVSDLLDRRGLTPETCYAYADSINDLPMRMLVGYPSAVRPDRQMRRMARDRYWPVYGDGVDRAQALAVAVLSPSGSAQDEYWTR